MLELKREQDRFARQKAMEDEKQEQFGSKRKNPLAVTVKNGNEKKQPGVHSPKKLLDLEKVAELMQPHTLRPPPLTLHGSGETEGDAKKVCLDG